MRLLQTKRRFVQTYKRNISLSRKIICHWFIYRLTVSKTDITCWERFVERNLVQGYDEIDDISELPENILVNCPLLLIHIVDNNRG